MPSAIQWPGPGWARPHRDHGLHRPGTGPYGDRRTACSAILHHEAATLVTSDGNLPHVHHVGLFHLPHLLTLLLAECHGPVLPVVHRLLLRHTWPACEWELRRRMCGAPSSSLTACAVPRGSHWDQCPLPAVRHPAPCVPCPPACHSPVHSRTACWPAATPWPCR